MQLSDQGHNPEDGVIKGPGEVDIYHRGPPLSTGPLPALFYFALSGKDSLYLDPYNQPAAFLEGASIRIFSLSLPRHETGQDYHKAVLGWYDELQEGNNIIEAFIRQSIKQIDYLEKKNLLLAGRIAVAGLSRGGFIAAHLAAQDERIHTVLGFAPMTRLAKEGEKTEDTLLQSLALENIAEGLAGKKLRFYIGNRDERVGTDSCYSFIRKLVEVSYEKKFRSPSVELFISPSIGHKGHGTPPLIFRDGANWIKDTIG